MAVYEYTDDGVNPTCFLTESHIYGGKRLGIYNRNVDMEASYTPPATEQRILGNRNYEMSNHLNNVLEVISDRLLTVDGNTDNFTDHYMADVISYCDYTPYGMVMPGRNGMNANYRNGFGGQEKVDEIKGSGNHYTAMFWEYDPRLGRRWNIDPVVKFHENPYAAFANNPLWFVDLMGADTSKLTGSSNLLIFIQDGNATIDYDRMLDESGDWDFIVVENIAGAETLLKEYYGDKFGFITNLVIKSHGGAYTGPDLDNASGVGVMHDPAGNEAMIYIRSLLTLDANICFTACSIIQGYNDSKHAGYKSSRETARNFSKFFLENTNRNMFMNYTLSTSTGFTDNNANGEMDKGDVYWFKFDSGLHQESWAGFMWFYYGKSGTWLKQKNFYQVIIDTGTWFASGGISVYPIRAIDAEDTTPNNEPPKKSTLL